MTVQYKGQSKELLIYMKQNEGPTLFGLEWLESIQLGTSGTSPALEDVLNRYAGLFFEGQMKNIKARIQLKESAQPRFWKARPISLALFSAD